VQLVGQLVAGQDCGHSLEHERVGVAVGWGCGGHGFGLLGLGGVRRVLSEYYPFGNYSASREEKFFCLGS